MEEKEFDPSSASSAAAMFFTASLKDRRVEVFVRDDLHKARVVRVCEDLTVDVSLSLSTPANEIVRVPAAAIRRWL